MKKLHIELSQLTAFAIGARGEAYNPTVIVNTLNILVQRHSHKDLQLMVIDSHPEHCGIDEAISHILADTYSEAAMQLLDSVKELQ